ncbi:hypothetical protein NDU88_001770 [Pleurodeles waltl]|uniref:KilA-N domain-containing protein n=1 Tax=Pleurodeles waltl TaxID=8319 RepID=A0AAV7UAE3_PLEWA|nr:hypothetical protein NDU88_001770 [Pleurodeles waltl]
MATDKEAIRRAAAEQLFDDIISKGSDYNECVELSSGRINRSQKSLCDMLWKYSKKEQSKWWEAVTLQKYIETGRIQRGLRIFIVPNVDNPDPGMVREWMENNHQCSVNMLKILVKYAWKEFEKLNIEIETISKELKERISGEGFETEMEKLNEKLRKAEEILKVKKQQKFLRDLKDYEKGQILTFGKKYEQVRNKTRETLVTAQLSNEVRIRDEREIIPRDVGKEIVKTVRAMYQLNLKVE